jgi:hypothetical protein
MSTQTKIPGFNAEASLETSEPHRYGARAAEGVGRGVEPAWMWYHGGCTWSCNARTGRIHCIPIVCLV